LNPFFHATDFPVELLVPGAVKSVTQSDCDFRGTTDLPPNGLDIPAGSFEASVNPSGFLTYLKVVSSTGYSEWTYSDYGIPVTETAPA
jgi:hypothetical protein